MLKSEHQLEINKYLNFMKLKKDKCIKEVEAAFSDMKSDVLVESIYNKEDVEEILQKFLAETTKIMETDVTNLIRSSGAYVQTALTEAEKAGLEIHVDLNFLDSNQAIENIKTLEKKPTKELDSKPKGFGAKLATLQGGFNNDPALNTKIQDLTKEVEGLKLRNQQLQAELVKQIKEKGGQKESMGEFSLTSESDYRNEIKQLEDKVRNKALEYDELKGDMAKKLNDSVQFQNLKKNVSYKK